MEQVGRPVRRKEGRAKVTGEALYVDDVGQPGMLHGVTVRSSIPRGRIAAIRFDPGIDWTDYVVVTAADIPGRNRVKLITDDQPYLAFEQVNHPEEPIVLIAHADRARADEARRRVTIEYEPLPPVLTIDDSLARREIIWGEDNIFKTLLGDEGRRGRGARGRRRRDRRRRVRDRRPGTALHRAERDARDRPSPLRRDGLGIDAVSLLRAHGARRPLRHAAASASASCRWRPAAASAARKNIRR